jgi:hypothetical protein
VSVPKITHKEAVLKILSDGRWHRTTEFINPECGSEGMRRLREVAKTHALEKRKAERGAQWEYRLVSRFAQPGLFGEG